MFYLIYLSLLVVATFSGLAAVLWWEKRDGG